MRTLSVCALLLALPPLAGAADAPAPTETIIRLKVQPRRAPKPALKYQLLPELREMQPGNPIHVYTLCFAEQYNFWHSKELMEKREKWQRMPLKDLPMQEAHRLCNRRNPLRYADEAARLDKPDWQILARMKRDGFMTLLPDVQGLRQVAGALKVRFRIEVAERRFDDALYTAQTMLALSRHFNEHPSLIGNLVGIAIAFLAIGPLDEMIEQPGCPNLYWALTDLPHPFIDLRKAMQGERIMIDTELAGVEDREPMSETQLRKVIDRLETRMKNINNGPGAPGLDVRKWLKERARNEDHVRAARKRLTETLAPADPSKFESFPPLQIVLLDEKLASETMHDERMKALPLPYWQARPVLDAIPQRKKDEPHPFDALITGIDKVKLSQTRLEQRFALLRCVEALRMYAAEHDGKLPPSLDGKLPLTFEDLHLPLPIDPVTGKPFIYQRDGAKAILRGSPPSGMEKVDAFNIRYEVTIAK